MRKPRVDPIAFQHALSLWDRPESELFGKPLPGDVDTDTIVEQLFSQPRAGFIAE